MDELSFSVLGKDPVPKQRPRTVWRGGKAITYTPERTKTWEAWVRAHALEHCIEPQDGYWDVTLTFYRKSGRQVDIDNLSKAVLDALNGVVWNDDKQVVHLDLHKLRVSTEIEAGVHIEAYRMEVDDELRYA